MSEILDNNNEALEVKTPQVALSQDQWTDIINMSDKLKAATVGIVATSEYYEAKVEGEKKRGVFIKFGETMHKDATAPGGYVYQKSIEFLDENRKLFVCSAKALVNEFERLNMAYGVAFEITFKKTEKNANGTIKIFEVALLATK